MTKKNYLKIIVLGMVLISIIFPLVFGVGLLFADTETLTLSKLLTASYKEQDITEVLDFTTNFEYEEEDDGGLIETSNGWRAPEYLDSEDKSLLLNSDLDYEDNTEEDGDKKHNGLYVADLISEDLSFHYNNVSFTFKSTFGADGNNNRFGLFFLTNIEGVLGAEADLEIPAQSIYVLTFKVNMGKNVKNKGLNVKIIDGEEVYAMSAITSTSSTYKSYAFLIRGHQFEKKTVQLQLLWGDIKKSSNDSYTKSGETGYAVVDTFQVFSINSKQYEELATVSANKQVDLFTSSDYEFIENGYFNHIKNANWNLENNTKMMDFLPEGWMQETEVTTDSNRVAHYGIVNIGSDRFNELNLINTKLDLVNPGNPPGSSVINNNVLILYNGNDTNFQNTYQTITSAEFTLPAKSYYEISFKFNTPALMESAEEENNSLNFYVVGSDGKPIYTRENIFSYTEWSETVNEWETFRLFIKTPDKEQKVKFIIKFGTEENTKSGYVYIDEINRSVAKPSADMMFNNTQENSYILKTEEGEEIQHLATGLISFEGLQELDLSPEMVSSTGQNRSLAFYDYTAPITVDPEDDEDEEDNPPIVDIGGMVNLDYLWYVIPSILLGLCVVLGLAIFYGRKLKGKIKFPKRRKKSSYDRRKTLNKQVSARESSSVTTDNVEKQLKSIRSQITQLEGTYKKAKAHPVTLKHYIKKREKLQNKELRLKEKLVKKE